MHSAASRSKNRRVIRKPGIANGSRSTRVPPQHATRTGFTSRYVSTSPIEQSRSQIGIGSVNSRPRVSPSALGTLVLSRPPLHTHHLHPPPPRMPREDHRHHFEALQPEVRRDKIVPLLVHPSDSPSREEEEPWMNRSAYAVNSGALHGNREEPRIAG